MSTDAMHEDKLMLQQLGKPIGALAKLPLSYRWEFTRRHPIYLKFWEAARQHRQKPSDDPTVAREGQWATLMLQLIGVSGEPVPPSSSAEELTAGDLGQVWEGGAIAPLTFRGLILLLIAAIPPEDRRGIADLINESARDSDLGIHPYFLAQRVCQNNHPLLDMLIPAPLVSINLQAPQRAIREAVESYVQKKKEEQNIPEIRRRDDSIEDHLRVWDLREGWTGTGYDPKLERTFSQIAKELKESIPTVRSRYQRAFALLIGHDFSAEVWFRLFGIDRVRSFGINANNLPPRYRTIGTFSCRKSPTPESQILVATDNRLGGMIAGKADSPCPVDEILLLDDIRELIQKGKTNVEIIAALELHEADRDLLINWVRSRIDDGTFAADL